MSLSGLEDIHKYSNIGTKLRPYGMTWLGSQLQRQICDW